MDSTLDVLAATAATAASLSTVPTSTNPAQASESVISPAVFNHPGPAASADVTAIVTNVATRTATATATTPGTATMTGATSEAVLAVTPATVPTMTPMSHQTKAQESLPSALAPGSIVSPLEISRACNSFVIESMNNGDFGAKMVDVSHKVLTMPKTHSVETFNGVSIAKSKLQSPKVLFESEENNHLSSFPPEFLSKPIHFLFYEA
jgi:hypothetical protein